MDDSPVSAHRAAGRPPGSRHPAAARLLCAALLAVLGVLLPGQTYPGAPVAGSSQAHTAQAASAGAPGTSGGGDTVAEAPGTGAVVGPDRSVTSTDHCTTPRAHRTVLFDQPLAHPGGVPTAGVLLPRPPAAGTPMPRAPDGPAGRPLTTACSGRAPPLSTGI